MTEIILSLKKFGAAFNKHVVLSSISFDIPETGMTVLMGPSGTGKSTLLKAISGFSTSNPAYRTWGDIDYLGGRLANSAAPPRLVSQNIKLMVATILENVIDGLPERRNLTLLQQRELAQRLLTQADLEEFCDQLDRPMMKVTTAAQRQITILRQMAANPNLVCIDEPTVQLNASETKRMIRYLRAEAKKRALLIVTHNQDVAKALGGQTVLLAGGWVQEVQSTDLFFSAPITDVAKTFIQTGSCALPSPDAKPEEVAPEWVAAIRPLPKAATNYKSHVLGPNGFIWLKKGKLAGTPRPGLLRELDDDLAALKRVGVTDLISLTIRPLDSERCIAYGIDVIASPIPDMEPPSFSEALTLNHKIEKLLVNKRIVAIHCRAGLGRTGTLLAAQLIYEGHSALVALEKTRQIEMRWVQSETQVNFLEGYEAFIKNQPNHSTPNADCCVIK
ncbi:MAG: ATP-binding cassette domain-containing protein [Cocleimonas sp.]|nr:ATP-binding cassette domain-containing protein [Cocleimonas sp.]